MAKWQVVILIVLVSACSSTPDRSDEYESVGSQMESWQWPLKKTVLMSGFGPRDGKFHTGVDLKGKTGTPIYATAGGVVVRSGTNSGGYGKMVVLEHPGEIFSFYAHASKLLVRVNQKVQKGKKIALVGGTGRVTTPHLHFEIRVGRVALDPIRLYKDRAIASQ